jgi:two-component system NarL family response regulator/two-component system response regulator DevR
MIPPVRVVIVDDHPEVRHALVNRLQADPGIRVVGETGDLEEALTTATRLRPDLIVIDTKRADGRGMELLHQVKDRHLAGATVILTSYLSDWEKWVAQQAGVAGYLLKDIDTQTLVHQLALIATAL